MKLLIAIVQDEDASKLISTLMNEGYGVTKLATTGGFLRAGNTTLLLEKLNEGAVAIWSSGAAGDVNPRMMNQIYYPCPVWGEQRTYYVQNYEVAEVMLKMLFARHLDDIKQTLSAIDSFAEEAELEGGIIEWSETPARDFVKDENGGTQIVTGDGVAPARVRVHGFRLGEVMFMGINGELYASLGAAMKDASPMKNTVLITHDSTPAGGSYIFDDFTLTSGQRECPGPIPALAATRFLPGYLKESLSGHAKSVAEKLL